MHCIWSAWCLPQEVNNHTRIEGCANSSARVRARRILPPLYRRDDSDNQPSAHPSRRPKERTATRAMTGLMSHWATTGGIIERCVHYYRSLFGNRSAERLKLVAITCRYSVRRSVVASDRHGGYTIDSSLSRPFRNRCRMSSAIVARPNDSCCLFSLRYAK